MFSFIQFLEQSCPTSCLGTSVLIKFLILWAFILSYVPGVETTRRFLLEWLSYTSRYVPVGLLDVIPQRLNWRPPSYFGRDDLETLMASDSAADWVQLCFLFRLSNLLN